MAEAPLLTSGEEVILGKKIQQLNAWETVRNALYEEAGGVVAPTATSGALAGSNGKSAYAADMDAKVSLEAWAKAVEFEGETAEFQRLVLEYRHAKDVMINSNMRLVISIARRYQHLGVSLQDLIQEGSLGLIRASEKFDPSRGFRFSTYASWWIQQAVFRSIAFHSRIIRLPMHVHNMLNRVRNTRKEIFMETGRVPSEEELAVRLDVPLDKLRLIMRSSRRIYSSNAPVQAKKRRGSGAGELSREMELCYEDQNEAEGKLPEEVVENRMFRTEMQDVLDVLEDDERFVICLRYGLGTAKRMSVSQIADLAASSKPWVKRTEARALRKLRRPHYQFKLQPYTEAHSPLKLSRFSFNNPEV